MARKILLVEGTDDEHVLRHICRGHRIPAPDEVKQSGGADRLLRYLPTQLNLSRGEDDDVGVVIDADNDLDARWQSLRDIFERAGYPNVPNQPDPNGTILEAPDGTLLPRAGVWLMPDNKTPGILEDFLRFLIPNQPNPLFDHVNASVDSIPDRLFSENDTPKAVIHTWLAWQKEPGRPYGTAITARFLDSQLPQARPLAGWLGRLFDAPPPS